ncbi:hypothetical protein [Sphingomonas echinoides]|uniref:hypothetical protein n=1 Tax=Sphingomonas echinoides TaxID=59803 RepID=UPI002412E928|nr:hypothetical protein [Sphingomonas echinoides]
MRVNSANSIKTANTVRARFGSWKAAKDSASYEDGKFVVRSAANGQFIATRTETPLKNS